MASNTEHDNFHATALAAVNEALVTLGNDTVLTELSASSAVPESRKAAYIYTGSRLKVLRDHDWNFARRITPICSSLVSVTEQNEPPSLPFICPIPSSVVRVLKCDTGSGRETEWSKYNNIIKSREPLASITYTADIEDLDKWSPDAYRALILRLAADLAKPITGRINERQLQEEAYARTLEDAKLADARESHISQDPWADNPYADAMRGSRLGHPPPPPFSIGAR